MHLMRGLKEYIDKHGHHFTVELAYAAGGSSYTDRQVYNYLQEEVYYNVSGTTLGDMVYMFNTLMFRSTKKETRKHLIDYLQTFYYLDNPKLFRRWLITQNDFDFTPYI